MSYSLEVSKLKLRLGKKEVLKSLDFQVKQGSCHALLGPNGAGKTSTISIILNLMKADSGKLKIFGENHSSENSFFKRASTPQETSFIESIKTKEILDFVKRIYGSSHSLEDYGKRFQLKTFWETPAQKLSGGQKRLLSIACAFISGANLLLLDEPTSGLDLESKELVWDEILKFRKEGGSILLTTHHMEEAEALSDEVSFLHQGRCIQSGPLQKLKNQFYKKKLSFQCENLPETDFQFTDLEKNRKLLVAEKPEKALEALYAKGAKIEDLIVEEASLEELFKIINYGVGDEK